MTQISAELSAAPLYIEQRKSEQNKISSNLLVLVNLERLIVSLIPWKLEHETWAMHFAFVLQRHGYRVTTRARTQSLTPRLTGVADGVQ